MRITKELVIILLLLAVSVWDISPRMEEYAGLYEQLTTLKKQLAKEQLFSNRQNEIAVQLESALQVHNENKKKMYAGDIPSGTAMSQLQEQIQLLLQQNGAEMVNLTWGEPFKKEGSSYYILPVSLTAQGGPPQIVGFLRQILSTEKLIRCSFININRGSKENLKLEAMLHGYQLAPEAK